MARDWAAADGASVTMSTGVNMGRHGTLAYWLVQMLSFVTGNLDRRGGNSQSVGYYDTVARGRTDYGRGFVDGGFGTVRAGALPGGLLADLILDAADQVRALIVIGGNPLLTIPGQRALAKAFEQLELLVFIDIYRSATGELAHWLLPATDQFEREDVSTAGLGMQVVP